MSKHNQFSRFFYKSALPLSQSDSISDSTPIDLQALSPGFCYKSALPLSQSDSVSESTESTLIDLQALSPEFFNRSALDLQALSPVHSDGAVRLQEPLTQIATITSNMAGAASSNCEDTDDDSFLFNSKADDSFLVNSKAPTASSDSEDTVDDSFLLNSKRTFPKKLPPKLQQGVEGSPNNFGAYESSDESDGDMLLCDLKDKVGTPFQKSKVGLVTMQDFENDEESSDDDVDDDDDGKKNTKVTIDNVTPRNLKIGKANDQKLGKENKKKVKGNTRRKKKNQPDSLWGKLRSSNGEPKKAYARRPKFVVDVKAKKKEKQEREYIHRLHDLTRPMPPPSYWMGKK